MSMDLTNAERQARHRAKQRQAQAAREAELRALRNTKQAHSFQPGEPVDAIARALFKTFEGYPDGKGRRIAQYWLNTITIQTRQTVADKPGPVGWHTPAQAKRWVQGTLSRVDMGWYVQTDWLRGHEHGVIQIIVFPVTGSTPLDGATQVLAALPGVYRIARIESEGSFSRELGEKRRQVRALMAVTERALQKQPLTGGWTSADIVIYDPRKPVT